MDSSVLNHDAYGLCSENDYWSRLLTVQGCVAVCELLIACLRHVLFALQSLLDHILAFQKAACVRLLIIISTFCPASSRMPSELLASRCVHSARHAYRADARKLTRLFQASNSNARTKQHKSRASRQTGDTPKAPGSESDFTDLPKNRDEIGVVTPITSQQMQVPIVPRYRI